MRYRERAICLRTTDYSETSQVVHFLTRGGGVVRLLAKGTKRPKSKSGGAIDLLGEGDLVFITSGGEALGTLIEFSESTAHPGLRAQGSRLNAALYMIELVGEMLPETDPYREVFDLLHNALVRLGEPDARPAAVLGYFQWRFLQYAGLLGDLQTCVECGKSFSQTGAVSRRETYFSSALGGLLCRDCEPAATEKLRVEPPALAALAALHATRRAKASGGRISLPDAQANAVNRLLNYHITQQLAKPLKLARHAIPPPRAARKH